MEPMQYPNPEPQRPVTRPNPRLEPAREWGPASAARYPYYRSLSSEPSEDEDLFVYEVGPRPR